jgi:hypothetical protein
MTTYLPLTAVHPSDFDPGTAQTPGSLRLAAIAHDRGISTGLWGGTSSSKQARAPESITTANRKPSSMS